MPSYTDTDRNAIADGAPDYDGVALFTDATGTVADGGALQAVTLGAAGAAGPGGSAHPATPGRRYTTAAVSFTLTEQATHFGWYVGATLHRVAPLRTPIGPGGPFPKVFAIQTR
jgi:hypothetical protein